MRAYGFDWASDPRVIPALELMIREQPSGTLPCVFDRYEPWDADENHLAACPDMHVQNARVDDHADEDGCRIALARAAAHCPHLGTVEAVYGEYGSLGRLLAFIESCD